MAAFASLDEVVSNGFCIGCGLCAAAAPSAKIRMVPAAGHEHLRPVPSRPLTDDEQGRIIATCPGVTVSGPFVDAPHNGMDSIWGENRRVARGHASDPDLRFRASSGGVMTAINRFLLRSGEVSFILQTKPDPHDALSTVAAICRDEESLMRGGGSRYATSAPLATVGQVLDLGEPFAVSLKPCDISGLRNLQRLDHRARDLIRFTQAMFCGTVPSLFASRAFFDRRGIDMATDPPEEFRWRGEGCPGPTRAVMSDGRVFEGTYNELWDENPWTTQFRCKICPDAIGLCADLAVGDDWPGGLPRGEDDGWNALIAHTETGLRILETCEAAGDLTLFDVDVRHLDGVQPHHVRLRRGLSARLSACAAAGIPAPEFHDLALCDCASAVSAEERSREYQGTLRRLMDEHGDDDQLADYGTAVLRQQEKN